MSSNLKRPDLYTVGWISVLIVERTAATALLDERHEEPPEFEQHRADDNSYTWGRMGKHNVVIASFEDGDSGTNSAALVAERMLLSLPHIRVGLLVGIGGGIPSVRRDIRLGDVAVSQRKDSSGGVVQYDFVKVKPGQKRERKDFLGKAPGVLLKAMGALKTEHELQPSKISKFLDDMISKYPKLAEPTDDRAGFIFPGSDVDRLFKDDYPHLGGDDCQVCDEGQLLPARNKRTANHPKIHYGIIASGNTVVKDAVSRRNLIEHLSEDCICYEMEAAGLMNNFPCLVIRGICDYADSHKNDQWHPYAAATAAAFAKELLDFVPQSALEKTEKAIEAVRDIAQDVSERLTKVEAITEDINSTLHDQNLDDWLSPPDPSINYNEAKKKRHKDTCQWFLQSKIFEQWKRTPGSFIWIHGLVGCGKTVLSSAIVDALHEDAEVRRTVLYYFFDYKEIAKQSLDGMIRSLICQLYPASKETQQLLMKVFSSCHRGTHQPSTDSLCETFQNMIVSLANVSIILDGLDECQKRNELLFWMRDLAKSKIPNLHVIGVSRREQDIESFVSRWITPEYVVEATEDSINKDIQTFVQHQVRRGDGLKMWQSYPKLQKEIETTLTEKANGMFRWVECQLIALEHCLDPYDIRRTLASLPTTLEETYARTIRNIPKNWTEKAVRLLQLLVYTDEPLTIEAGVDALAVNLSEKPHFDPENRMPEPRLLLRICSSLVSTTIQEVSFYKKKEVVRLAHFSVKEYLLSDRVDHIIRHSIAEIPARSSIVRVYLEYVSQIGKDRIENFMAFPLVDYASGWIDHIISSEVETAVQERILTFFLGEQQAYRKWNTLVGTAETISSTKVVASPLYHASAAGLNNTVERLIQNGAECNEKHILGSHSWNPLLMAAVNGHEKIVQLLLAHMTDPKETLASNPKILRGAVCNQHYNTVELLLEHGANPDERLSGESALSRAVKFQNRKMVQLLLEHGANPNYIVEFRHSILTKAITDQNEEFVEFLLKLGFYENLKSGEGKSLLGEALFRNNTRIMQLFLDHLTDPNERFGSMPILTFAVASGNESFVRLFLDYGADPNVKVAGHTILYRVKVWTKIVVPAKIVQLLVDHGAIEA